MLQIGERARDLQQPVGRTQGEVQAFAGIFKPGLVLRQQRAMLAQGRKIEERIGAALTLVLSFARAGHCLRGAGAGFSTLRSGCKRRGFPCDGQVQIDPVKQRARQLVAITLDLVGRAAAAAGRLAVIAAWAGIHMLVL